MSLLDAFKKARDIRQCVRPNDNFWRHLVSQEARLRGTCSCSIQHGCSPRRSRDATPRRSRKLSRGQGGTQCKLPRPSGMPSKRPMHPMHPMHPICAILGPFSAWHAQSRMSSIPSSSAPHTIHISSYLSFATCRGPREWPGHNCGSLSHILPPLFFSTCPCCHIACGGTPEVIYYCVILRLAICALPASRSRVVPRVSIL